MTKSLDGVLIKKANQKETFTQEHITELLNCTDPDTGYLYFMKNYFYIQHPVKGKIIFEPYEYQVKLLRSYNDHRFNINMLPRQSGKTTCAAGYLLWYAMFNPDQTILVAAQNIQDTLETPTVKLAQTNTFMMGIFINSFLM